MEKVSGLIVGFMLLSQLDVGTTFKLICYFTNWAQHRPGIGKFMPENIPPCLCTHLIYAFAAIDNHHKIVTKEKNDEALYASFNGLKKKNPNLKTLLAIGGFNPQRFSTTVATKKTRATFIFSAIKFVRKYDFDGLDLVWDHPGSRGNPFDNKKRYTVLLKELRQNLHTESKRTKRPRLLLAAALPASKAKIDAGFEVKKVGHYLDSIHVMTYDFQSAWNTFATHNNPLFHAIPKQRESTFFNMEFAAKYWRENGLPAEKLIIGFPTYGRTFMLKSSANNSGGAPTVGPGPAGIYTRDPGYWAYYEICDFLKSADKPIYTSQMVPFASKGKVWLGYDDMNNFETKVQWMKDNKFGGAFLWTIDLDDLQNHCKQGVLPLTTRLNKLLEINSGCGKLNMENSRRVPTDIDQGWCSNKDIGIYPDPTDITKFYRCAKIAVHERCGENQIFDQECKCCTWPQFKTYYDPTWCYNKRDGFYPDENDVSKFYICAGHQVFWRDCAKGLVFHIGCKCCNWPITNRQGPRSLRENEGVFNNLF
ncbi:acidic mammalian chitinase-like [Chiloscyllium punctatum]|uniref:acidic mammalian chitinase-like n=1 Tax=Chiloscyllium punctatum TaxID=137246 RepID=UPI003B633795